MIFSFSSSRRKRRAILVVLATIMALLVASARSPDAVFATMFARAAAQDTHEATLRTTPSSSDGSDHIVAGLRASFEAPKTVTDARDEGDEKADHHHHPLIARRESVFRIGYQDAVFSRVDGRTLPTSDPPTRGRARLMVFLN